MHTYTSRILRLALLAATLVSLLPAQNYEGWIDRADCDVISGWAYNGINDTPVNVVVYYGTTQIAVVTANAFRSDLAANGIGNGYHAWALATLISSKTV